MSKSVLVLFISIIYLSGCATPPNKHLLKVNSTPPDALVSVHETGDVSAGGSRLIAGTTPLEKDFDFGKDSQLWLEIERRGYAPHVEKVIPESGQVSIDLSKVKDENGEYISEYAFPKINRLLLVTPDIKIIERGFSSEKVSEEKSKIAKEELIKGTVNFFEGKNEVVTVESSDVNTKLLKPLWRAVRSSMELLDPIRLKYFAHPPYLETKSSRKAAKKLGAEYETEAILLIMGKQNNETGGLVAGKIGVSVAGTATSFAGSYNRAVSNGDSFFVYNIYTPSFAQGTYLKAALIDCKNGEVLWINSGLWGAIPFGESKILDRVLSDLLTGIN